MSIRAAWKAFFGDPAWLKRTALAAVIAYLPYVGSVATMGFAMRHTRDVAWGRGQKLPEWREFDKHLKSGFFGLVAAMVYSLPVSLAFSVVIAAILVAGIASAAETGEPTFLIPVIVALALMMVVMTVLGSLLWAVITHVALYDTIKSGFELKAIWKTTVDNSHDFGRAWGRALLLSLASSTVVFGMVGLLLGAYVASVFANASEEIYTLGMIAFYPLEFVVMFIAMFVSFPVSVMNANIWGQYARVAYRLDRPA